MGIFGGSALKLAQNMLHNPAQLASRKKGINSVVQEYKLLYMYFCDLHTYSGKIKLTLILQNSWALGFAHKKIECLKTVLILHNIFVLKILLPKSIIKKKQLRLFCCCFNLNLAGLLELSALKLSTFYLYIIVLRVLLTSG